MNNEIHPARVLVKAICLFLLINFLYVLVEPLGLRVSGYNVLFPGRTRLPFGIRGDPYTVTVDNVDVMFSSHLVAAPRRPDEFRVALIGDSSVWGEGLGAYEIISEQWNNQNPSCGEKTIRVYNLGYPHPSVVKDLVILNKALEYEPDLVIWFVTLNTVISQRLNPFLIANRERTVDVLNAYDISFRQGKRLVESEPGFFEKTLIGQRSNLARSLKLQTLGIIWAATGADTNRLAEEASQSFEVGDDIRYRGMEPSQDLKDLLLFGAIQAGYRIAGSVPIFVVNEPIFIAPRAEEMVRYNSTYPRWAYDQYREALAAQAQSAGWDYLDLWNAIPPQYFLDPSLHLGVEGERLLIEQIAPVVLAVGCDPNP